MNRIDAENITVRINGKLIVNRACLHAKSGEIVGLIGPNGAGKSTLLRAILGLVTAEDEKVYLDGTSIQDINLQDRAKKIAYAAQGGTIHWPMIVERLIALGRIPHLDPWRTPMVEDQAALDRAMRLTDTTHLKDRIATTLSGGERASVLLARAIAVDAPILIADEPVASLDPFHQLQVMNVLKSLTDNGTSVVVVLHDLNLAVRFCQRLYLMQDGKTVAYGTPEEVLSDDMLRTVYQVEASRGQVNGEAYLLPWRQVKTHGQVAEE